MSIAIILSLPMCSRQRIAARVENEKDSKKPSTGWSNRSLKHIHGTTFIVDGRTDWTGVRNYQARNNLREMKTGDRVLVLPFRKRQSCCWHCGSCETRLPDPTADDPQWVAVDLKPVKAFASPVPLPAIRYDKRLSGLPLIRQSQLSVMPLTKDEFDVLVAMGNGKNRKR